MEQLARMARRRRLIPQDYFGSVLIGDYSPPLQDLVDPTDRLELNPSLALLKTRLNEAVEEKC